MKCKNMKKKGRIGSSFDDFLKQEGIYEEVTAHVMPLTRSFKEFVKSRIGRDPKFRQALFQEAVQTLFEGDVDTAKAVLRDYINATIGFPALAEATRMPPKSLMRMFGPKGNPTAVNLFGVIAALQDKTGVHLQVRAVADAA